MKDTTPEIEKIQRELMMKMTPNQRIAMACEMFMNSRELFLASLPKDLSDEEVKKRLYFRTYGEYLPEDFFER
ncbi:MAG: hypothetical protein ACR2MD_08950 [Aridibacter sp.]|jgi:hypothetical protein|nr:hypothetical protein [Acidobacteriota bacterium]